MTRRVRAAKEKQGLAEDVYIDRGNIKIIIRKVTRSFMVRP